MGEAARLFAQQMAMQNGNANGYVPQATALGTEINPDAHERKFAARIGTMLSMFTGGMMKILPSGTQLPGIFGIGDARGMHTGQIHSVLGGKRDINRNTLDRIAASMHEDFKKMVGGAQQAMQAGFNAISSMSASALGAAQSMGARLFKAGVTPGSLSAREMDHNFMALATPGMNAARGQAASMPQH